MYHTYVSTNISNNNVCVRFSHQMLCIVARPFVQVGQDFWPVTWPNQVAFDPVTNPVIERFESNRQQRLDSSIGYLLGNPNRLVA